MLPNIDPKGNANSLPAGKTAALSTPPSDSTGALSRAGLADLLQMRAATPEPEPPAPSPEPPAAPAESPEPAAGDTEISAPTAEAVPGAGDQPAETESDLSQPAEPPPDPAAPEPEGEDKGLTPGVQKRIDQIRHKLGDAEREIERLRSEKADLEAKVKPGPPGPPTPSLMNAEEIKLADRENQLRTALKIIRENPDGIELNGRTWTGEQLAAEREEYEAELASIKVERRQATQRKAEQKKLLDADAAKRHPWLNDLTDQRTQVARQFLAYQPALASEPVMLSMLADAIAYRAAQKAAPAKSKPAPPKPPPPAPAKPAAAPVNRDARKAELETAEAQLSKTHSREALAALLAARGGR